MPDRTLGEYPEVDMHSLPYADQTFDLIVHSDTLEHVENPVKALSECRRVLKPGGLLAYTVPIIVDRLTRDRKGLPNSYHGAPSSNASDFQVVTEYGADAWKHVVEAGFVDVCLSTFDYPAELQLVHRAQAIISRKPRGWENSFQEEKNRKSFSDGRRLEVSIVPLSASRIRHGVLRSVRCV